MKNVLIIGCGVVGTNLSKEISVLNPDIVDKYKPELTTKEADKHYDVAFICVDTPYVRKGRSCDTTEVMNCIKENPADIYVIKSTCPVGTVDNLTSQGVKVVFSPEYYGGTQHCNNYDYNFTILGGEKSICCEVVQLLQNVYDASHKFYITEAKTAELCKYMENCFLATKVSFCTEFYAAARECGVNYEELRELFVLDPRIHPSHTFVYRDHPYWESHCLDKDTRAFAEQFDSLLFIKNVITYNEIVKEQFHAEEEHE